MIKNKKLVSTRATLFVEINELFGSALQLGLMKLLNSATQRGSLGHFEL